MTEIERAREGIEEYRIGYGQSQLPTDCIIQLMMGHSKSEQLILSGVSPRLLFDNGLKYYKELAEESGNELNIDIASMIAKDYVKHVNHFLNLNGG